ncbi:hypothetical protein LOKO_03493 [Halomonas chromatireducens]|uniref:Uncharacterized protein n=1 Tax=Halomonas chromatireducens TaxID=507626 RepID=A0A0X8HH49_9GAMM|nr:hypothetical protein LOKO_03493 [Halomonas chromatireducens]
MSHSPAGGRPSPLTPTLVHCETMIRGRCAQPLREYIARTKQDAHADES